MCDRLGIRNTAEFYELPRMDIFNWWAYVPFNEEDYPRTAMSKKQALENIERERSNG